MENTAPSPTAVRERATLRSVNNALSILESFSTEKPELGVTELARALGLGKSTVHRLLTSLSVRGYVRKNPQTDRYCLGLKAFEVGSVAAGQHMIRETAAPLLRRLSTACRETVHLGVLDDGDVVYVDKIESPQALQMYSRIGRRAPAHCTALGKAILAWEPDDTVERLLNRRLKAYTPRTLTDGASLRADLAEIRARGYATDDDEFELGLRCIAAPVRDHTGRVVASLGIASPSVRLPAERVASMADVVRSTAGEVSVALGWKEPRR